MARTIRDSNLETRTARSRLKSRGRPYYRSIEPGLHLGYRKPAKGAGKWVVRHYVGDEAYDVETVATADDFSDADGVAILDFRQAQALARERMIARAHAAAGKGKPLTVADAMDLYRKGRSPHTLRDARYRDLAHIRPKLGKCEVGSLTAEELR